MAQRRMFSKTITNSSRFLMLPLSAQALYFHLGMNADDDGFCEHFTIMRMTEAKPDELRLLQARKFVHVFDDRVLVVLDWKENNYLRSDRYNPSKYVKHYNAEILSLSEDHGIGIPDGNQWDTQDRIGKDRIGKDSKERGSKFTPPTTDEVQLYLNERHITQFTASAFCDFYQSRGWMIGKNKMKDWQAAVRTWEAREPKPKIQNPQDRIKELEEIEKQWNQKNS